MNKKNLGILFFCIVVASSTSCSNAPGGGSLSGFLAQLQKEINAALDVMQGKRSELGKTPPSPASSARASEAADKQQANAELLREVFLVVFQQEPKAGEFFSSYLGSLNQGASFEGIYNGFTHSAHYRQLETTHPGPASAKARAYFIQQLTDFESLLQDKTQFTLQSGEPLAPMMSMGEMEASAQDGGSGKLTPGKNGVSEIEFGNKKKEAEPKKAEAHSHEQIFEKSSIYTLKRVLSDEALKLVESLRAKSSADLSRWYGVWAAGMNRNGIAYGLALRNRADAAFHEEWALKAPADALTWEVLNRIHRTLNQLEKNP